MSIKYLIGRCSSNVEAPPAWPTRAPLRACVVLAVVFPTRNVYVRASILYGWATVKADLFRSRSHLINLDSVI